MPEVDKQTHILIQQPTNDSEIEVVLGMLAGESSESAELELRRGTPEQLGATRKKVDSLTSPRRKQPSQSDAKADVSEAKQKKGKLRHTSDMQSMSSRANR